MNLLFKGQNWGCTHLSNTLVKGCWRNHSQVTLERSNYARDSLHHWHNHWAPYDWAACGWAAIKCADDQQVALSGFSTTAQMFNRRCKWMFQSYCHTQDTTQADKKNTPAHTSAREKTGFHTSKSCIALWWARSVFQAPFRKKKKEKKERTYKHRLFPLVLLPNWCGLWFSKAIVDGWINFRVGRVWGVVLKEESTEKVEHKQGHVCLITHTFGVVSVNVAIRQGQKKNMIYATMERLTVKSEQWHS